MKALAELARLFADDPGFALATLGAAAAAALAIAAGVPARLGGLLLAGLLALVFVATLRQDGKHAAAKDRR